MESASAPITDRRTRWPAAVGYGLLAEVATIATIILVVIAYRNLIAPGLTDAAYAAFGERAGALVGVSAGTLFTFIFARRLMRRVSTRRVEHGLVVALAAIALSVGGSIAGHQGVPSLYLAASALKLGAGALAGVLARRG